MTSWDALMTAEPRLDRQIDDDELEAALDAVADFVDLKSPFTIGHSLGVADLAGKAACHLDLPAGDVTTVRRAALVHDVGRLGVSNAVWDKQAPLTHAEVERVRLHPYLTERVLASTPVLVALADLAVQHHERLDGSGHPRGFKGDAITTGGRILAAADMYRTKVEQRPHRPSAPPGEVAACCGTRCAQGVSTVTPWRRCCERPDIAPAAGVESGRPA